MGSLYSTECPCYPTKRSSPPNGSFCLHHGSAQCLSDLNLLFAGRPKSMKWRQDFLPTIYHCLIWYSNMSWISNTFASILGSYDLASAPCEDILLSFDCDHACERSSRGWNSSMCTYGLQFHLVEMALACFWMVSSSYDFREFELPVEHSYLSISIDHLSILHFLSYSSSSSLQFTQSNDDHRCCAYHAETSSEECCLMLVLACRFGWANLVWPFSASWFLPAFCCWEPRLPSLLIRTHLRFEESYSHSWRALLTVLELWNLHLIA